MSEFVEATACTKCQGALVRKDGVKYPGLCCEDCVQLYPTKEWIDALNGTST
jgi:hypothetical protein